MKKHKIKYIYYFRSNLAYGVHFYQAWVRAVIRNGIPMVLLTFLDLGKYIKQYELVKKYRKDGIRIYPDITGRIFSHLFFYFTCLFNKKVVIHLKKRDTEQFDKLKQYFPRKVIYIYEGEGDAISELDYLEKHPYKNNFYKDTIVSLKIEAAKQRTVFLKADYCTYGYRAMKNMLIDRYPDLGLEKKITLLPMSFTKGSLIYSNALREKKRIELSLTDRFVIIYIGNAFYSWQNVYRTIQVFKLIKCSLKPNAFLILLIRRQDFFIVEEFINSLQLKDDDYLLDNVYFEEIQGYLNASDLGVCLRHRHIMNQTTPSGKVLDYLGCGLPVLITDTMGEVSRDVRTNNFGVVLNDMDDDNEIISGVKNWIVHDCEKRKSISVWANENLSIDANIVEYITLLKKL